MSLRSPLARVLGRGSAKAGVHHWWVQRLTSVALVPLAIWLLVSLIALPVLDYPRLCGWLARGPSAPLLILFILVATWHSELGVRVVIEDYVHTEGVKTVTLVLSRFAHIVLALAAVWAVLRIAFGIRA